MKVSTPHLSSDQVQAKSLSQALGSQRLLAQQPKTDRPGSDFVDFARSLLSNPKLLITLDMPPDEISQSSNPDLNPDDFEKIDKAITSGIVPSEPTERAKKTTSLSPIIEKAKTLQGQLGGKDDGEATRNKTFLVSRGKSSKHFLKVF